MEDVWSLHDIPRRKIIHRMKFSDILELSLKSEPFHNFLKANKLPEVELHWYFVGYISYMILKSPSSNREPMIGFDKNMYLNEASSIKFCIDPTELKMKLITRKWDKFSIENCKNQEEKLMAMEAMSKYVAEIAHVKYKLHNDRQWEFDVTKSFVFKITKSFLEVHIDGITEEQIRFLAEHPGIEHLYLKCVLSGNEKLKDIKFYQKRLTLEGCRWMKPKELFNCSKLEYIEYDYSSFDLSNFVSFVDAWQKGVHFEHLKSLKINDRWVSKRNWLVTQEDGTLGLTRTEIAEPESFIRYIKRFSDGKMAKVEASVKVRPMPYRSKVIVCFTVDG